MTTSRLLLVTALLAGGPAWAYRAGIAGYSGKAGPTCAACHSGGAKPTVALSGPTSLMPGQTGKFTFTITTGAKITGMNAAATDGVTLKAGTNTKLKGGEVVHGSAVAPTGGKVDYMFSIVAPATAGAVTVWASGLAADDNGGTTGDATAATTAMVTVEAAPPDGGAPADLAGPGPADLAGAPDLTGPPSDDAAPPAEDAATAPTGGGETPPAGGCAYAGAPAPSLAALVALALLLLIARRRVTAAAAPCASRDRA